MDKLQLEVLLKAIDQVTGPLKSITGGSQETAKAVREAKGALKELEQQHEVDPSVKTNTRQV
ncbi:MAG: hypothetical protein KKG92_11220 [Gammaproteobacteria bacterium]|nr:hypothetical protein [Gammaproteobacteria bacterium]